jgi:membrane dipeptidase
MTMRREEALELATKLHTEAIVFDHVTSLVESPFPRGIQDHLAGGVTVVGQTASAGADSSAAQSLARISTILKRINRLPDQAMLVESVADMHRAKQQGKLGVMLHFQTCSPFERDLGLIEVFYRIGVRVALLTYNIQNYVSDGIAETGNAGLSKFGRRVIEDMNRVGMVVDGSHSGEKATFQAMEISSAPVIFSHSNCKAVYNHMRNITDDQIRACAQTGGVIGMIGLPYFTAPGRDPKIEDIVKHAVHIAELVGTDHIGLAMDYFDGIVPYATPEQEVARLTVQDSAGDLWSPGDIPVHPWSLAPGLETPAGMRDLTAALFQHGFSYEDCRKIVGGNFLRVFEQVWKPTSAATASRPDA